MTTKRIATAYLPSGKEIKFVFDEASCEESHTAYSLDGKAVSIIPYSIPVSFEDWEEEPKYDSEKLKKAFDDYAKSLPIRTAYSPNFTVEELDAERKNMKEFFRNYINGVDMTDTHTMD